MLEPRYALLIDVRQPGRSLGKVTDQSAETVSYPCDCHPILRDRVIIFRSAITRKDSRMLKYPCRVLSRKHVCQLYCLVRRHSDTPSRITSDFGVASRIILQLQGVNAGYSEDGTRFLPFIEFDLKRTRVGEHVVIGTHASKDSVHRT